MGEGGVKKAAWEGAQGANVTAMEGSVSAVGGPELKIQDAWQSLGFGTGASHLTPQ